VEGDGPVSEEGAKAWKSGGVVVNVVRGVVVANLGDVDLAMLSREVTNLASLGEFAVTGRCLEMRCQR
jgi:hypothetical protein